MGKIIVVGLGSGPMDQMTLGGWRVIREAGELFVRTTEHPAVKELQQSGIQIESFDPLYEKSNSFPEVYAQIVEELLSRAASSTRPVLYGVPGHPSVAEATVQLLRLRCVEQDIELSLIGGESFLDQAFMKLGMDPVDGFMLLDAARMTAAQLQPQLHLFITQVYDSFTASDAKLTLLELYPPEYEIVVGKGLGIPDQEQVLRIPLEELDRQREYGNHVMVWVPRSDEETLRNRSFERLREIVEILRSPGGCPWDQEQTHESIRKNLIEETCEVLETIDEFDPDAMCEELGDLLLQIMLHTQMEAETGMFSIGDVIQGLNEKLIRRHPHVFGELQAGDAGEALVNWEQVKTEEKKAKGIDFSSRSLLDGIPPALPGTMKAWQYQKRAAKVGFDWDRVEDAFDKLREEVEELQELLTAKASDEDDRIDLEAKRQEELGDVLFSIVNVARFLKLDPEEALVAVNRKFYKRFTYIEQSLIERGKTFADADLSEMENLWQEAKRVK